ncbi:MAG: hypothetical protein HYV29_01275, partial [Ignavibacteriales bacterium]|nr:hypothetical protein [Ignavibacteriales bacterium]
MKIESYHFSSHLLCSKIVIIILILLFVSVSLGNASGKTKLPTKQGSANIVASQNQYTLSGNRWSMEMTNYGPYGQDIVGRLPFAGGAGGEFPKASGLYLLFAAGLQIGAMVDGIPKVSVIDHSSEFQPGALQKSDPYSKTEIPVPADPGSPLNKLFALYANGSDGTPVGPNGDAIDDYSNWPSQFGAQTKPDGSPLIVGDLMSWSVFNDMDSSKHTIPDDSQKHPMALEVQQMSIQIKKVQQDSIFYMHWKIINKGIKDLNSAYVSGWFDPDVDASGNDLIATDTNAGMVFTYNANNSDPLSQGGSAFGAKFLQGPIITGTMSDTAMYFELTKNGFVQRVVPGKKVMGVTSTVRYINVQGSEGDPTNDAELYNLMQGKEKNGDPKTVRYIYPADPLTAPADQLDPRPDDKRMMLSIGPFDLAVGDTQVIILACIGATGSDRLNAIQKLRATASAVDRNNSQLFLKPEAEVSTTHPYSSMTNVSVHANLQQFANVTSCEVYFAPETGSEPPFSLALFDDGLHQDNAANDDIWGNAIVVTNRKYPHAGKIIVNKGDPSQQDFPEFFPSVCLRPVPILSDWHVIWENGKQDKLINHNERVHVAFEVGNMDSINSISTLAVFGEFNRTSDFISEITPLGSLVHDSLKLVLSAPPTGDSLGFWYTVKFDGNEKMVFRKNPIAPWDPGTTWRDTLSVTAVHGLATLLQPIVADPTLTTGHMYVITFFKNMIDQTIRWRLKDSTTGALKLDSAWTTVPVNFPHPVIDGIEYQFNTPAPNFTDFLETANAGGPHTPTYASFTFNGSGFPNTLTPLQDRPTANVGGASWGIHTG